MSESDSGRASPSNNGICVIIEKRLLLMFDFYFRNGWSYDDRESTKYSCNGIDWSQGISCQVSWFQIVIFIKSTYSWPWTILHQKGEHRKNVYFS